jgi:hypothetical protein
MLLVLSLKNPVVGASYLCFCILISITGPYIMLCTFFIGLDRLWTSTLLFSAYWVARLTCMSHWHQFWCGTLDPPVWFFPSAELTSCTNMPSFIWWHLFLPWVSSLLPCFLSYFLPLFLLPNYSFYISPFLMISTISLGSFFGNYLLYQVNISVYTMVPIFFSFVVLGFEPRAYTLRHSTRPFLWRFFQNMVSWSICPGQW